MTRTAAIATLFILSGASISFAQQAAPGNQTIREADLRADLFFLASDAMRGRLTDTPENRLAAEFIKSRFERMGLKPAGPDNSFYQNFNLTRASLGADNRLVMFGRSQNRELTLQVGQDFYPLRFSVSGRAKGQLVYAGFGITSPDRSHDDYKRGSFTGKIVMVLDHEPGERDPASPFDGLVRSEASRNLRKALYAQEQGAAAILFVSDVHNHPGPINFEAAAKRYWPDPPRRKSRYILTEWMERVRIPAVQISPTTAKTLLADAKRTLVDLAKAAEQQGGVTPVAIPNLEIDLTVSVNRHTVQERNVVGLMEGSDPKASDEWIIVCAHYDHDGADGDRVYNGADDDCSGTVAVIEIAEAYAMAASQGERPRRSVLFAAWNAEEVGLLGAWAYTENPLNPLNKTVAVLNMDMIGRNEEVPVGGGRRFRGLEIQTAEPNNNSVNVMGYSFSPDLTSLVEKANSAFGLSLKMEYDNNPSNLLRRSDQWPFLQNGVPAVFFHTGLHPDYHTEFDVPERINYAKMEKIVRLVHQVSWDLAEQEARPGFTHRSVKTHSTNSSIAERR
ncbi:M28 family peptidase [bacterium]|nr:M28 family peptidase [bacterium]